MGWIRVSDDFYDNDKMIRAGSIGRDLYWHGMAFCNRNLTDGLIPIGRATILVDFTDAAVMTSNYGGADGQECAPIAVERLIDADLWHEDGHDCPNCVQPGPRHYIVHDYLQYQPSRAEVEEKAEANRERVRRFKEKRKADGNAVGNAATNALANGAANGPVMVEVHDTPTPTPTPTPRLSTREDTPRKRGAPLPENWMPDDDTILWAKTEHPNVDLKTAHEKFSNYWRSVAGQKRLKLDWTATWRNWIIREDEHLANNRNGNGARSPTPASAAATGWLTLGTDTPPLKEIR